MAGRRVFAVVLILVGLVLLANNLGLVTWSLRDAFRVLWPLILVLFGVSLILEGTGAGAGAGWFAGIVLLLVAGAAVAVRAGWIPEGRLWGVSEARTKSFQVPAGAYHPQAVRLHVSLGSSRVTIAEKEEPGFLSTQATYYLPEDEPRLSQAMSGETLVLDYAEKGGRAFGIRFASHQARHEIQLQDSGVATDILVDLGSGDGTVELGRTNLRELRLDIGSGTLSCRATEPLAEASEVFTCEVGSGSLEVTRLGDLKPREVDVKVGSGSGRVNLDGEWVPGVVDVRLEVGSGKLEVVIPAGAGFAITGRTGSGALYVNGVRRQGRRVDYSERFDVAPVRLRIIADVGSGELRVWALQTGRVEV
ncbi:MAG: LiaI-LiaF-like domain-containing protein [Ignavibacteriales bacterium]